MCVVTFLLLLSCLGPKGLDGFRSLLVGSIFVPWNVSGFLLRSIFFTWNHTVRNIIGDLMLKKWCSCCNIEYVQLEANNLQLGCGKGHYFPDSLLVVSSSMFSFQPDETLFNEVALWYVIKHILGACRKMYEIFIDQQHIWKRSAISKFKFQIRAEHLTLINNLPFGARNFLAPARILR